MCDNMNVKLWINKFVYNNEDNYWLEIEGWLRYKNRDYCKCMFALNKVNLVKESYFS